MEPRSTSRRIGPGGSLLLFRLPFQLYRSYSGGLCRSHQGTMTDYSLAIVVYADAKMLCRWLIANGRTEQAQDILASFHTGGDASHPLIRFEIEEISYAIEREKQSSETSWSTLVKTPGNRKRSIIAICVGAFAQWNVSWEPFSHSANLLCGNLASQDKLTNSYRELLSCHTISLSF